MSCMKKIMFLCLFSLLLTNSYAQAPNTDESKSDVQSILDELNNGKKFTVLEVDSSARQTLLPTLIELSLEKVNGLLPMRTENATINNFVYDRKDLHMYLTIDDNKTQMFQDTVLLKSTILNNLVYSGQGNELYTSLAELGNGIVYHYSDAEGSYRQDIRLTSNEVEMIATASIKGTAFDELSALAEKTNNNCPMALDEITVLDSMVIDEKRLSYYHTLFFDMTLSDFQIEMFRGALRNNLTRNATVQYLVKLVVNAGLDLRYCYTKPTPAKKGKKSKKTNNSDSNYRFEITFTNEELKTLLQ